MTPSKIADPLLPEQIAELRALDEKATPAPWHQSGDVAAYGYLETASVMRCCGNATPTGECCGNGVPGTEAEPVEQEVLCGHTDDVAFIVALRNSLPQLLELAERGIAAGEEVERLTQIVTELDADVAFAACQWHDLQRSLTKAEAALTKAEEEAKSWRRVAERLEEEAKALREALRPFAEAHDDPDIPGGFTTETELIERFRDHHSHGEWFRANPDLIEFIRSCPPSPDGHTYESALAEFIAGLPK